jgi:protein arginine N-methyltransferase 1
VHLSNAPDVPERFSTVIYSPVFFPWSAPVALAVGDTVSVTLQANLVGEDYIWRWDTCVRDHSDPGCIKANFKQSTFWGTPLSPTQLRKRSASHVPRLNEEGRIERLIFEMMDKSTPLGDIARQISAQFPGHFARWQDALTRVGELSLKWSQ